MINKIFHCVHYDLVKECKQIKNLNAKNAIGNAKNAMTY